MKTLLFDLWLKRPNCDVLPPVCEKRYNKCDVVSDCKSTKMPSCVFRKCTNYDKKVNKAQGISYHMFPTCEVQLHDWIAVVRRQRNEYEWKPSQSSRICSAHFDANDKYTSNKGRTLLKNNAVPIIEKSEAKNIHNSPSSLDNVSIPEIEEILESPRKAAFRKRVRKLTFEKKQLQKKYKVICQQNKRLKKKLASMSVILKDLKNKDFITKEQFEQLTLKRL